MSNAATQLTKTRLFKQKVMNRKMYVWEEDPNHQNLDGERLIILLIQSLPKKIIS